MNYPIEKLGYTIKETCFAIGIGRTKVYSEIKNGRLKKVKVDDRSLIVNVPEYVERLKQEAGHATAS